MRNNNFRFRKSERVHLKKVFHNIISEGKKIEDKFLRFYFLPNSEKKVRFATVINKKFGKAVERNKAKRVCREIFRQIKWKFSDYYDIICYIKPEFKKLQFEEKKNLSMSY